MATHKPFRELLPPDSNFEFVGRAKIWITFSLLTIVASIGMLFVNKTVRGDYLNWTIDFKGGTEAVLAFSKDGRPTDVPAGDVRKTLDDEGYTGYSVSDFSWDVADSATGQVNTVRGMRVTLKEFGAVPEADKEKLRENLRKAFGASVEYVGWSGDRVFVRSRAPIDFATGAKIIEAAHYEPRKWEEELAAEFALADQGTGEYHAYFAIRGVDAQVERQLEQKLGVDVKVEQTYAVGAKAGSELRDDGIKSLFYALALIMLYMVFRFDVRYAPGAVVATIHDAIICIGALALTWQEVSLTTVAALLTIIGYSVNDTVIIFDRIRENVEKLKDKKFSRIINISINETLGRSLLTSLLVFAVTLTMNIFGTGLVRDFAFVMNVGVIAGAYSTVFIASPVALWIHDRWFAASMSAAAKAAGARRPARKVEAEEADEAAEVDAPEPDFSADDDDGGDDDSPGGAKPTKPKRKKFKRKSR